VPYRSHADRPLLPWEKEIIDILGVSVEEYQWFVKETTERARIRPAEYDLVPDIRNAPALTVFLVSLAVGLVTSAVSYLLAPKPGGGRGSQLTLASRSGNERFSQTTGFDSLAELAAYGEAVPIIWTRFTGSTGGVVVSPKMVWSRIANRGGNQAAKMLFVVGEGGVQPPDRAGIYLGNNGLNLLNRQDFAFWWNSNARVQRSSLLYGTQYDLISGDPTNTSDIYQTPIGADAFCFAYTPTNNTAFGISNPIPNGTQYRVNYKVVSIPKDLETKAQLRRERAKIVGYGHYEDPVVGRRQFGVGANYPRRQGIAGYSSKVNFNVSVGNSIDFLISPVYLAKFLYGGDPAQVSAANAGGGEMTDVNNTLDAECAAADDILQLGETIMIGGSIWRVSNRSLPVWNPGQTQVIRLTCIEVVDSSLIGAPGSSEFINSSYITRNQQPAEKVVSTVFWPLAKVSTALVKNTRPCQATQIGIRSNVWGRFNGIANFNALPRSLQIEAYDKGNVTVTSGTMTEYFERTSVFTIHWRELGSTGWTRTNQYFAVRGSQPKDQFNAINCFHNGTRALEFRLIPIPAAVLVKMPLSFNLYWLGGAGTFSVSGNGITLSGRGGAIPISNVKGNAQMFTTGVPQVIPGTTTVTVSQVQYIDVINNVQTEYKFWSQIRSGQVPANLPVGATTTVQYVSSKTDGRSITLRLYLRVEVSLKGLKRWSRPEKIEIVSQNTGTIEWGVTNFVNDSFVLSSNTTIDGVTLKAGTPIGIKMQVTAVSKTTTPPQTIQGSRRFEGNTQIAEVSYYGSLITRSCDSTFEHQISHVNEFVEHKSTPSYRNLTTTGLSLRSGQNLNGLDQVRCFIKSGVTNSNSFPRLVQYLLQNATGISSSLLDTASFDTADAFCAGRQLLFDGVIADRVNLRSYIAELAPFFLLNFVIANGKFALQPAIPATANVPIAQIFTANNIIEDSLQVDFLPADQRRDFQALMTYRTHALNQLPVVKTYRARFADVPDSVPIETFDMTNYCTSQRHAEQVARYFLSIRRRITHSIQFKTAPEGAGIAPGAYIKVALQQTAVSNYSNGVINTDGSVVSPQPLANGSYPITYYKSGSDNISTGTLVLSNGRTTQPELFGTLFTLSSSNVTSATYLIEQIELDQDGLLSVTATEFPAAQILSDMAGTGILVVES
jgi:hypothetical protein